METICTTIHIEKNLYIDFDTCKLQILEDGKSTNDKHLTKSEAALFKYLIEHRGKICRKTDILLMPEFEYSSIEQLNKHICAIRDKIDDLFKEEDIGKKILQTRTRIGVILAKEDTASCSRVKGSQGSQELQYLQSLRDELNGNIELAIETNRKLAEEGYPPSINYMGVAYIKGKGVERDRILGRRYYQQAADLKYSKAQLNLGDFYMDSSEAEYDPNTAFKYYLDAAENKVDADGDAMYRLYICYTHGLGCKKNSKRAEKWLNDAKEKGVYKYISY